VSDNNRNYAGISGILSIISGAIGICMGLMFAGLGVFFFFMMNGIGFPVDTDTMTEAMPWLFTGIYGAIGLLMALIGIFAIIGGVFSIKKKSWGWALAGAICGCLVFFYTGIAAVILVCLSKSEFETIKHANVPEAVAFPPAH
jgi:hypothetical protein